MLVLLVLLVAFPLVAPGAVVNVGVYALIYSLAALGLSLLMGLAGQVSLGQAGFFAIGAYTQAVLVTRYEVNALGAAVVAVAVTMAAALLVGLPAMVGLNAGLAIKQRVSTRALTYAFAALMVVVAVRLALA